MLFSNLSIKFYTLPGNRAAKKTKVYLIPVLTNHAQKKKNLYCRKVLQNCEKSPTSLTRSHHATLWTTKSDCNLLIAHQAIVHQQVFNNHAIPQVSEAQKTRKFQIRQSRGSDTGAINQPNSRLEKHKSRVQFLTSSQLYKPDTTEKCNKYLCLLHVDF